LFTACSIATAFAPNPTLFIIFTAIKGVGAAINTPAAIGILSSAFEHGSKRALVMSCWAAAQPLGKIVGNFLGGVLTSTSFGWKSIFFLQCGLGAVFTIMGFVVLKVDEKVKRYEKGFDWIGAVLSVAGLGLITYSLSYVSFSPRMAFGC
jgi:MFS family permease